MAINGIRCSRIDYKIPSPFLKAQCQVKIPTKQNMESPFALLSHYNGLSCSSPFEQLTDRDINLTNQWAEVRLHEELQKISATQLMDAMLQ